MGRGSRVVGQGSRVVDQGSWVVSRGFDANQYRGEDYENHIAISVPSLQLNGAFIS